jgi:hypothetical protein
LKFAAVIVMVSGPAMVSLLLVIARAWFP